MPLRKVTFENTVDVFVPNDIVTVLKAEIKQDLEICETLPLWNEGIAMNKFHAMSVQLQCSHLRKMYNFSNI